MQDNNTEKIISINRDNLLNNAKKDIDKATNMNEVATIINEYAISLLDEYTLKKYSSDKSNKDILSDFYRNSTAYPDALELIKYTPKRFHSTNIYKDLLESYTNLNKPKRSKKPKPNN